jgi:hypothetical protein
MNWPLYFAVLEALIADYDAVIDSKELDDEWRPVYIAARQQAVNLLLNAREVHRITRVNLN